MPVKLLDNILLVDGSNLFYRSFYAIKYGSQRTNHTLNRGLLEAHVFMNTFLSSLKKFHPCAAIICWDFGKSEYRKALYPDYKGNRADRDPADEKRMAYLRGVMSDLFPKLGLLSIGVQGVEADDLICYFWRVFKKDFNVVILSNDADLSQFPGTLLCNADVDARYVTKDAAREILLSKIVCGDKSDNIPKGVVGVGPKKFTQLISDVGLSYSAILGHYADDMDVVEALELNRKLVDLRLVNKQVVHSGVKKRIYKLMTKYTQLKYSKLNAVSTVRRIGLKNFSANVSGQDMLGVCHERTNNLCRRALSKRRGVRRRSSVTL